MYNSDSLPLQPQDSGQIVVPDSITDDMCTDVFQEENLGPAEEAGKLNKMHRIINIGRDDFRKASGFSKLAVASTIGLYAYEIGPGGNETVAPIVLGVVASHTHNAFPGSPIVALATGSFIATEQYIAGKLTSKSIRSFPNMSKAVYEIINSQQKENDTYKTFTELPTSKKVTYALAGGAGFTVSREAFAVGNTDTKRLNKISRTSTFITASAVGVLAGTVDAADKLSDNSFVHKAAGLIENPLFWISILSAKVGIDVVKSKLTKRKNAKNLDTDHVT
jgi:hypothetical protein